MTLNNIYQNLKHIVDDSALKKTVEQYKTKLKVFSDLRDALGVALKSTKQGLRQNDESTSSQELKKIKTAVNKFMHSFEEQIDTTTDESLKASFISVKKRIEKYWNRLFADPLVVPINGEEKIFYVHRTNNIMEHQFRSMAYSYRRVHGNHSIRRNLENIPDGW